MTNDFEKYDAECERIRAENAELLDGFANWLSVKGLSPGTIQNHCWNIDFYVNHFMLYYDAWDASSGIGQVDKYLGYWFIKKAMWARPSSMKSNAASLKKFYTFMFETGKVDKDALDDLKAEIREGLPEWLETLARYDDPEVDFADVWE